ncbi:serine hydrolase [Flavobacterium sp. CAU 1735]|uniref:serine hydrolase n=1 Tax=Flavobacterium sp. CAU 1735 TaxID=3140361 RepID=UPI003260748E
MKPTLSTIAILAFTFGCMILPASAQTKSNSKNDISKVESGLMPAVRFKGEPLWTLESRMKHYAIPGMSIAVIKNSKVIWSKSYGFADVESKTPVESKTLFQAASISKPVSAYAALKTVASGKLNLDADVNLYLKSWKIPENEFTKEKKVSLKNILSHTAGLTGHGFAGYEAGAPLPSVIQILNGQKPANSPAVVVDKLPGTSFRYSGGGYTIMQQLLMDLENKDFASIMSEKVLVPLEMKNSTFVQPLPTAQASFAATAYNVNGVRVPGKYHTYPEQAAAGLWTTAEDLAKFVIDIQNTVNHKSSLVLSQKMAEAFTTPFIESFIGLGIFLENKNGQVYFSHGGWNEGFSSKFVGNKTNGDGIVVLTNTNKPEFIEELIRSVASVYQWPDYITPAHTILPLTQQDFNNTGRYKSNKYGFYKVYSDNGKLMLINNIERPVALLKISENTYALRDAPFNVKITGDTKMGTKELTLVFPDEPARPGNPQLKNDEKVPLELLLEGSFEKGQKAYQNAKTEDPNHQSLSEDYLNRLGYSLLSQKDFTKAIAIFRVNTLLYPDSENVYDSLGEAYMNTREKDKAKQNYQKALELNPKNENAAQILKTL